MLPQEAASSVGSASLLASPAVLCKNSVSCDQSVRDQGRVRAIGKIKFCRNGVVGQDDRGIPTNRRVQDDYQLVPRISAAAKHQFIYGPGVVFPETGRKTARLFGDFAGERL